MGHRRQKRRIGLDQQPVCGSSSGDIPHHTGTSEGDDAWNGNVPAGGANLLHRGDVAGEAVVEHAGPTKCLFFLQDPESFAIGFAVVDDDRLIQFQRELNLRAETGSLRVAGGVVVVIIEAHLTKGDAARIGGKLADRRRHLVGPILGIVRMNADGKPNVGVPIRHSSGTSHTRDFVTRPDGDHARHAGGSGPRNRGVYPVISAEYIGIQVAVTVGEHRASTLVVTG